MQVLELPRSWTGGFWVLFSGNAYRTMDAETGRFYICGEANVFQGSRWNRINAVPVGTQGRSPSC